MLHMKPGSDTTVRKLCRQYECITKLFHNICKAEIKINQINLQAYNKQDH